MNKKDLFKNFYNELYKDILDEYYIQIENTNEECCDETCNVELTHNHTHHHHHHH